MEKVRVGDWIRFTRLGRMYVDTIYFHKKYKVTELDKHNDDFLMRVEGSPAWFNPGLPETSPWYIEYEIVKSDSKKKDEISVAASDYDFSISCRSIIEKMDKLTKEDQQDLLALLNHRYFRGSNA